MNEHKHILILDDYQKRISLDNHNLVVTGEDVEAKVFPLSELESVLIAKTGGSITLSALHSLIHQGIGFNILDYRHNEMATVSPKNKQALWLSKKQHHWYDSGKAHELALKTIQDKVWHQKQVVYELKRRKYFKTLLPRTKQRISMALNQLSKVSSLLNQMVEDSLEPSNVPNDSQESKAVVQKTLFTLEAKAAKYYWKAIGLYLPKSYGFDARHKYGERPDPFNAALNYGYAILSARVTQQLCALGFDPHLGFLHADQSGRVSLTYDVMERYRQKYVDVPILRYALSRESWNLDRKGRLDQESKKAITWNILEALDPREPNGIQQISRDLRRLREAVLSDCTWLTEPNKRQGFKLS